MADFRLIPGMWVKIVKDMPAVKGKTLLTGTIVQILGTPTVWTSSITFVGVVGYYYEFGGVHDTLF